MIGDGSPAVPIGLIGTIATHRGKGDVIRANQFFIMGIVGGDSCRRLAGIVALRR
jgi:hypothetical protein